MPLPTDERLLTLAQNILAQFDAIFGLHPGFRAAHAKGILLKGKFTPSSEAATLSRAVHLNQPSTDISVRFSNSTGIPVIPDNDPNAVPHGMAIRFHLADHVHTDIVAHSTDAFPANTGEDFLQFLRAIAASDLSKPSDPENPSPIEKHLGAHPAALAFVQAPKPSPSSFAREAYFGVTAFRFVNQQGWNQFVRYRLVPSAGVDHLDPATAKAKSPNFLFDEIAERIGRGAIEFKFMGQLANVGDVVSDATIHWAEDRKVVELGTLRITSIASDNAAEQKQIIFDPIPRTDGIEPSADPLLELRAAIYLLGGRRRRAAKV